MIYFLYFLLFMLGASLGSFIGAQVWREGKGVKSKRSLCDGCGNTLTWYRLIPVFSSAYGYFAKESCSHCECKISFNYFILEFVSGSFLALLTIFLFKNNFLAEVFTSYAVLFIQIMVASISTYFLIRLSYEDFLESAVTAKMVYLFLFFSILIMVVSIFTMNSLIAHIIALILSAPFLAIALLSRERALGLGDPLVLFSTLILFASFSPSSPLSVFLYTIWSGAILSCVYLLFKYKKFEKGVQVPFLPFLIIGILILLITNYYVFTLSDIMYTWHFFLG